MERLRCIIIKMFVICLFIYTFSSLTKSNYYSFGYYNLEFFRFGTLMNYLLIGMLFLVNHELLETEQFENYLIELCVKSFVFSSLIYLLFVLSSYSKLIFLVIIVSISIVIFYYTVLRIKYFFTLNKSRFYYYSAIISKRIILLTFILLLTTIPIFIFFELKYNSNLIDLENNLYPKDKGRIEILKENYEKFEILYSDKFANLTNLEKIKLFQEVELLEARLDGRPAQRIIIEDLDINHLGYFSAIFHKIAINKELFESNNYLSILEVVLHEGRHATQFYMINSVRDNKNFKELTFFNDIESIRDNYFEYIEYSSKHNNYMDYQNQPVEIDAQFHALTALMGYKEVFNPKVDEETSVEP